MATRKEFIESAFVTFVSNKTFGTRHDLALYEARKIADLVGYPEDGEHDDVLDAALIKAHQKRQFGDAHQEIPDIQARMQARAAARQAAPTKP